MAHSTHWWDPPAALSALFDPDDVALAREIANPTVRIRRSDYERFVALALEMRELRRSIGHKPVATALIQGSLLVRAIKLADSVCVDAEQDYRSYSDSGEG